jgi:hypothetical protein
MDKRLQLTQVYFNSIKQNPSRQANRHSTIQKIPRILYNPKAYYRSQQSATGLHSKQRQSSPHPPTVRLQDPF